ncbi:MAG: D-alanyl-D-alanine carboxypeptidase, partial [Actinobacteria bacterium]|nr:D-alanyl-D-alanine carboxypeptidase [Actinomycetota bacterium]
MSPARRLLALALALALGAILAIAVGPPASAGARPPAAQTAAGLPLPAPVLARLRRVMAAEMGKAGPSAGALVIDLVTGRELFAARPDTPRAPASVEKLYTTAAALARFGPDARLRTTVAGVGSPDDRGTWHGDLFLRGGGDPTFGSRTAP